MPWSLVGAERAGRALGGMITRGRLPHALLITGPPGCGKRTLALDAAKAVNCLSPEADGSPCQKCLPCRKMASGSHPDLLRVAPEGKSRTIKIESIRDLRDKLVYKPYEGRTQVGVIESADRLSPDSGGALLKTLEEPAEDTLIILTAVSSSMVMDTLVSRSVVIKIPPLPRPVLLAALAERRDLAAFDAALIAGLSQGALGRALELDAADARWLWAALGSALGAGPAPSRLARAGEFGARFLERAGLSRQREADSEPDDGGGPEGGARLVEMFLTAARLFLRDLLVLKAGGGPESLEGPPPTEGLIRAAEGLTMREAFAYEGGISLLRDSLARKVPPELALENFWRRGA